AVRDRLVRAGTTRGSAAVGDTALSAVNLLPETGHIERRIRFATLRDCNFLMSTDARSRQTELLAQCLAQFRVSVDLTGRPRGIVRQSRVLRLNANGVGVCVTARGHTTSMVGNTSCDEVHGAVTCQEQLREWPGQPWAPIGNNVQ